MTKNTIYIEIDDEIIMLNPDYDMSEVIRWTNADYPSGYCH